MTEFGNDFKRYQDKFQSIVNRSVGIDESMITFFFLERVTRRHKKRRGESTS